MEQLLSKELADRLSELIVDRLSEGSGADIRVKSIEVSENRLEILIEVEIGDVAEPDLIAEKYFGLTGRVRDALGQRWKDFYPVITPTFSEGVHA